MFRAAVQPGAEVAVTTIAGAERRPETRGGLLRRRNRGEVAVGERDDFDGAVLDRAIRQDDCIGAQCFTNETQRVTTRCADKFTNVQAGPPMR